MKLSCIMLASGYGRRFGGNKLLSEIGGKSLILRALEAVPRSLRVNTILVSQYPEILGLASEFGVVCVSNPMQDCEISASIKIGVSELDNDSDGCMFMVCDQPYLTEKTIKLLINCFTESPDSIVAPAYSGKRGNPVIFPKKYFRELSSLSGPECGGDVIKRHINSLRLVEIDDPMELFDVDTCDDLSETQD